MKRSLFALLVVLSLGFTVTAYAADNVAPAAAPAPVEIKYGINPGDNIKPVALATIDGSKKIAVNTLKTKSIFMIISSVCTACRTEIKDLTDNAEKFKDKADIYAVIIDMDPKSAAERIGALPFTTLGDSDYQLGMATNLMAAPSTVIVQDGKILYSKSGYRAGQWKEYLR